MKKKRGFTLIEILAGFLIVSILSVSITAVILNGINSTNEQRARIIATSVAEYYVQTTKNAVDVKKLTSSYDSAKVVSYDSTNTDHYNEEDLINNSTLLTETISPSYISNYSSQALYKSLFDPTQKFVFDGTTYDSSNVKVKIGVKMATSGGKDYKSGYVVVIINYYKTRTLEVIRDVY